MPPKPRSRHLTKFLSFSNQHHFLVSASFTTSVGLSEPFYLPSPLPRTSVHKIPNPLIVISSEIPPRPSDANARVHRKHHGLTPELLQSAPWMPTHLTGRIQPLLVVSAQPFKANTQDAQSPDASQSLVNVVVPAALEAGVAYAGDAKATIRSPQFLWLVVCYTHQLHSHLSRIHSFLPPVIINMVGVFFSYS
jgi:hypothetical protein